MVPVLILLFVVLWFILRGDLFQVLPGVIFVLVFFSPLSIAMASLWEERTNLVAFSICSIYASLVWSLSSFFSCLKRAAAL